MIQKVLYFIAVFGAISSIAMLLIGIHIDVDAIVYISYATLIITAIIVSIKCAEAMRFKNNRQDGIRYSRIIFALLAVLTIPFAIMIGGMIGGAVIGKIIPQSWSTSNSSKLQHLYTSLGMIGVFAGIFFTIVIPEVVIVSVNRLFLGIKMKNMDCGSTPPPP